jgi:hypothetical protein
MDMNTKSRTPHIPELGEILKFLLDCFDIPKNESPLSYKQIERLAKSKDLSEEKMEKVARSVLDAIYCKLHKLDHVEKRTDQILQEWQKDPLKMVGLEYDECGEVVLPKDQILKDLIELCWRHQFILNGLKNCREGSRELLYWLSGFLIPYITSTLVDYYFTANNPESGMPGGRLWYLPKIVRTDDEREPKRLQMPSEQVLLWWEDLLGRDLEDLSAELGGPGSQSESVRREIRAWKNEGRAPSFATIDEWTKRKWEYRGAFLDDQTLTLAERWCACRNFLEKKGMIGESEWQKELAQSPYETDREVAKAYRGERLEEEIPPFSNYAFKIFFDSIDPIAQKLPIEALINKVAKRWRPPTNIELHSRLIIGRGMNKALDASAKTLGTKRTLELTGWFCRSHNHFMMLCSRSEKLSPSESMKIHSELVEVADPDFHPIAAMLDPYYWETLPQFLRNWIRGEVRFK